MLNSTATFLRPALQKEIDNSNFVETALINCNDDLYTTLLDSVSLIVNGWFSEEKPTKDYLINYNNLRQLLIQNELDITMMQLIDWYCTDF